MPVSADSLLPPTWRQEDFSYVYALAIAAAAGVAWDVPRRDVNSCDVRFYARDDGLEDGPQLFAQLKCTSNGLTTSGDYPTEPKVTGSNPVGRVGKDPANSRVFTLPTARQLLMGQLMGQPQRSLAAP